MGPHIRPYFIRLRGCYFANPEIHPRCHRPILSRLDHNSKTDSRFLQTRVCVEKYFLQALHKLVFRVQEPDSHPSSMLLQTVDGVLAVNRVFLQSYIACSRVDLQNLWNHGRSINFQSLLDGRDNCQAQ